jgi:hypothetical protein
MSGRKICIYLILVWTIAALAIGCKKSSTEQTGATPTAKPPPSQAAATAETVARIHWLGKRRLATETNAAAFMSIWALPESQKLEAQTLDKLALAPWNVPREGTNTAAIVATNADSLLLRPLLEDLVQEECYLEIRAVTNQPAELALAVRIEDARSRLWKTNLTTVLGSLTNNPSLPTKNPIFLRTANWTVIGFLPDGQEKRDPANLGQGGWITELAGRIGQNGDLFTAEETNSLLKTELDLSGVSKALGLGWKLPAETPKITLSLSTEAGLVRTTGRLNFNNPLPLNLDEWQVPTNLVHDPLTSFTAIRGIKSFLASSKAWDTLQLGPPPNQVYVWGQGSLPLTTFWAAPLPDASNHIYQFTEHLIHDLNPWLTTNAMGEFQRTTNANAAIWGGLPFADPYLRSVTLPEGDFIFGGVGASPSTNRPTPVGLVEQFLPRTNIICFDWELTGARIESAIYISQLIRFIFQKAQVPPDSLSFNWFKAVAPKLGNCATMVALTGPDTLSFGRRSSVGLSASELQILADWLESPQFPNGLTTFVGKAPPPLHHAHHTNSVTTPKPNK